MVNSPERIGSSCDDARATSCSERLLNDTYQQAKDGATGKECTLKLNNGAETADSLPGLQLDSPLVQGSTVHTTIMVDGQPREFLLHIPPGYDPAKPMPLMVMFNGANGNPSEIDHNTQMSAKADQEGFIVAYPQGKGPLGTFNNGEAPYNSPNVNDVAFTKQIIDTLGNDLAIDKQRVYLAGFSQGGSFAELAASKLSNQVAGVADVEGWMSGKEQRPSQAVDSIFIHGDADWLIPAGGTDSVPDTGGGNIITTLLSPLKILGDIGTGNVLGLPSDLTSLRSLLLYGLQEGGLSYIEPQSYTRNFWSTADGITSGATETRSGSATIDDYRGPNNTEIEQVTINGGQHAWPGGTESNPITGAPVQDFSATDEIWAFLSRHTLNDGAAATTANA